MEKVLDIIRAKNEDLEARPRWNNLRILGLPESTAMQKMETYIADLLMELFGDSLSKVMVVERAHHSRSSPSAWYDTAPYYSTIIKLC